MGHVGKESALGLVGMLRLHQGILQRLCLLLLFPHLLGNLHNLVNIIQPQVKAKQLELFIDTFEVVNEDVIADALKLNQVFINLLT